jgi:hypothetical protein
VIRLGRSRARAEVEIAPAVVSPTESIVATVTLAEPIDRVAAARVQLGYVNRCSYRWAGRRDAALRHDDSSLLTLGQVGTDAGSDRNTEDWVAVLDEELPFAGGTLAPASRCAGRSRSPRAERCPRPTSACCCSACGRRTRSSARPASRRSSTAGPCSSTRG